MGYSQFGDDDYLLTLFEPSFKGTCIEVGSAQPIYGNNTYLLEQLGWTVHCIEPNPKLIERLRPIRKNVYQYAIGKMDLDNIDFTICTLKDGNQEAISSLKVDEKLLENHIQYSPTLEKIKVNVRTLKTFIEENNISNIDLISIDTEGTELDVLIGLDLLKYRPKVFVIENNFENKLLRYYMSSFGYSHVKRMGVNDFFIKEVEITETPTLNYSTTGNVGDLFHELYVVKRYNELTNLKGNIYLKYPGHSYDGRFIRDLNDVCNEINQTFSNYEYFNKCFVNDDRVPNMISLDSWRYSENLFKLCWTEMFCKEYELELPKGEVEPWVYKINQVQDFKNKVLIHQSTERKTNTFPWEKILENNDCIFISFEEKQYDSFEFKNKVPLLLLEDFSECISLLSSCKFYVGNLTSVSAIAQCMKIPRLLEFVFVANDGKYVGDFVHNMEESKYSDNLFYHSDNIDVRKLTGISQYINGLN